MSNYIPLDEAAKLLGLSVQRLNEMRSNSEIFGYRDGKSWKFKMQELQRVADELGVKIRPPRLTPGSEDDLGFDLDSSEELIQDDSSSREMLGSGEQKLADSGNVLSDSNADEELRFGSSDINLASDSGILGPGDTGDLLDDEPKKAKSPSDTGALLSDSADLVMSEEDLFDDELTLQDSSSYEDSVDLSSDFEDSSDSVMEDSDSSTEVTLEANESGINLSTSESGIDLDEPELVAAEVDDRFDLEEIGPEDSTMLQEDDFNLTPLEDALEDETSGSQIIALEDSEIFADESAATVLAPASGEQAQPMLTDETMEYGQGFGPGAYPGVYPGQAPIPGMAPVLPESPYTFAQVLSLGATFLILSLGGMVAFDLARNLWIPEDQVVSSGILKFFLSIVGQD
jgi:hypothetical protein